MLDLGFRECGSTFEVTFLKNYLSSGRFGSVRFESRLAHESSFTLHFCKLGYEQGCFFYKNSHGTLYMDRKPCRRDTSHFGNFFVLYTLSQSMSSLAAPRWACLKEETLMVYRKTGDQVQERLPILLLRESTVAFEVVKPSKAAVLTRNCFSQLT